MGDLIRKSFAVIYSAVFLGAVAFLLYQGVSKAYLCPDVNNVVFKNDALSVYAPTRRGVPCPIIRDGTVFTAGSAGNNYYYPQVPSEKSITFLSQSNYQDLPTSKRIKVTVGGLEPGSPYFFQVTGSDEIHRFTTKPAQGSVRPFRFAVISDTQGPYDLLGQKNLDKYRLAVPSFDRANSQKTRNRNIVVEAMRRVGPSEWSIQFPRQVYEFREFVQEVRYAPNYKDLLLTELIGELSYKPFFPRSTKPFDLVLHLGDVVEDARYATSWTNDMFDQLRDLLTLAPVYPAIGSHGYNHPTFDRYFELPGTSVGRRSADSYDYTFEWSHAGFIILDLNSVWYEILDVDAVDAEQALYFSRDALRAAADYLPPRSMDRVRFLQGRTIRHGKVIELIEKAGLSRSESRRLRTAAEFPDAQRENRKNNANIETGRVEIGRKKSDEDLREQLVWLEQKLEEFADKKFLFVSSHHPLVYAHYKEEMITSLLEKYKVSAYFGGHMHNYTHNVDTGIHYFTSGGGGARMNLTPLPRKSRKSLVRESYSTHYLDIEVDTHEVRISARREDNSVIELTRIPAR